MPHLFHQVAQEVEAVDQVQPEALCIFVSTSSTGHSQSRQRVVWVAMVQRGRVMLVAVEAEGADLVA